MAGARARLLLSDGDTRESGNLLHRSFLLLLERGEGPRIRFPDLRHTAATLLLGSGVHPKVASEMLGHVTVAMTLDTYSHVTETMQRSAVSALEEVLLMPESG